MQCRFGFLDGQARTLDITSTTTAGAVAKQLLRDIHVKDEQWWSIYEDMDHRYDRQLRSNEYIADVLYSWEKDGKKYASKIDEAPKLLVKKRLSRHPEQVPLDPVEYSLIQAQVSFICSCLMKIRSHHYVSRRLDL